MKKIKILFVGMTSITGGIETYIYNLFNNLDKNQFEIYFLKEIDENLYMQDSIQEKGGKFCEIHSRRKHFIKYLKDLKKIYKSNNFDYIHFHTCKFSHFFKYIFACKYSKAHIIFHSHQFRTKKILNKATRYLDKIGRFLLKHKKVFLAACSYEAYNYMFEGFDNAINKEPIIFRNGINLDKFNYNDEYRSFIRNKYNIPESCVLYGHVGRFSEQKNQTFVIKIFNEIHKIDSNSKMIFLGDGESIDIIKNYCLSNNIQDDVIFTGNVDDVEKYMSAIDKLIFPSLYEGLGLVLIEAQACNLPVYASKDVIPNDAKVSKLLTFISLNEDEKEWANKIISSNVTKSDVHNDIVQAGYDMNMTSSYIANFYITHLGDEE